MRWVVMDGVVVTGSFGIVDRVDTIVLIELFVLFATVVVVGIVVDVGGVVVVLLIVVVEGSGCADRA